MRPVIVTWLDAATESHMNWEAPDVPPLGDQEVRTIGFLRSETPERIELVMSVSETEIAGRWMIPRCCVVSIKEVQ